MTAFRLSRRSGYGIFVGFAALLLTGFIVLNALAPGGRRLARIEGIDTVNYFGISHSLLFGHDFSLTNEFTHSVAGNPADGYSRFAIHICCLANAVMTSLALIVLFTLLLRVETEWGVPEERATPVPAIDACCIFTTLFAVQYRVNLIPNNETLTFNELFTDKLRLLQVRAR